MRTLDFASDLPRPGADRVVVYVLGPGYGESQVVVFPDGRVLVVDSCEQHGQNLPRLLLHQLGIQKVHLLVVSHPDLDHLKGIAALVGEFEPRRIWTYPFGLWSMRELLAKWSDEWSRRSPQTRARFRELQEALEIIEAEHPEYGYRTVEALFSGEIWPSITHAYQVCRLAPTHKDRTRVKSVLERITRPDNRRDYALGERFQRFLRGEASLGDAPNVLSVAVALQWGDRRILLGGDVMNGTKSKSSGWKGVLFHLENDEETQHLAGVVRLLDVVKVAHHGSRGSFHGPAWERHARPDGTTVAVLTPFQSKLPENSTLSRLSGFAGRLGISSQEGGGAVRAREAGWVDMEGPEPATTAPCVAVVLRQTGDVELFRGAGAALFRRRSSPDVSGPAGTPP